MYRSNNGVFNHYTIWPVSSYGKVALPVKCLFTPITIRENQPVSSVFETLLLVREVLGSNIGLVKWDTVSPTGRWRCDVSSELCCPLAKPRRRDSPPVTLSSYREYNEDLILA